MFRRKLDICGALVKLQALHGFYTTPTAFSALMHTRHQGEAVPDKAFG
jgi:hypothetical protein